MKQKLVPGQKIICLNRKASFNYFFIELLEAGIALKGSEVKSLRDGKGSIADSYAIDNNGELYLINSHIPLYRQSSYNNHDPKEDRKLIKHSKDFGYFKLNAKCNWKFAIENYCESYHLPWIHPELNKVSNISDHYHIEDENFNFSGQ